MSIRLDTWGELCEINGNEPGGLAPETKVTRLISGGGLIKSSALKNPEAPPCMFGGGCSSGGCGI